jgi:hypothetical protein
MILLGVVLVILGLVFGITLLWVAGAILIVLGLLFWRTNTGPFNGRWY